MYSAGADIVFNNLELCVQIESGSEYTEFEQFVPNMPSPDYPSDIKCCGDGNVFDLYKFIEDANNSSYYEKNNENLVINKTDTRNEGFTYYLNLIVGGRYKITATNLVSIRVYEEGNVTPIININDVTSCEFIATSKKMAVKFISSNTLPYTVGKVEIFGVINVNICNKNKFNKNTVFSGKYIGANGGIQSQEGISYSDYIYVEPNISYYFGDRGTWVSVAQYDKNKTFISRITIPIGTYQFTEDVKFIRCNIDNTYLDTFQLEEGETGTEYVEHKEQIYTIPVQKPFNKIENYRDTFIKQNGKRYEKYLIKKLVLNGTENWLSNTVSTGEPQYYLKITDTPEIWKALSNYFVAKVNSILGYHFYMNVASNLLVFPNPVFEGSSIATVEDWKAWLAEQYANGTPVEVYYVLATPELIECTPEQNEILDQIENEAQTYKNITHIYSTDEVSPIFDLECFKDIETLIANSGGA